MVTEGTQNAGRANALNAFNLTNLLFGQTTNAYRDINSTNDSGARMIEFGLRFTFKAEGKKRPAASLWTPTGPWQVNDMPHVGRGLNGQPALAISVQHQEQEREAGQQADG
jgi:hypothetical protein